MNCENCEQEHDGTFATGRFCSLKCSRSFATKYKRKEINQKVSNSLKGRQVGGAVPGRIKGKPKIIEHREKLGKAMMIHTIRNLSKRTITKILKRLNLGCSRCGWKETISDIHHIIHRKKGGSDEHENLVYLCPNCHRLAHDGKIVEFITMKEQVGERWRDFYFPELAGI